MQSNNSGEYEIIDMNDGRTITVRFIKTGTICNVDRSCVYHGSIKDKLNYKSRVNDQLYQSMYYGPFKIVDDLGNIGKHNDRYVIIRFEYTGAENTVRYDHALVGCVKDPVLKNPFNARKILGPIPIINVRNMLKQTYDVLISRCKKVKATGYAKYGAKGVTISERWGNFDNFLYDAQLLPGWMQKFNDPLMYQLDKDLLQYNLDINQKVYSRETCVWMRMNINSGALKNSSAYLIDEENGIISIENLYYVVTGADCRNFGPYTTYEAALNVAAYHNNITADVPYMHPSEIMSCYLDAREMCKIV